MWLRVSNVLQGWHPYGGCSDVGHLDPVGVLRSSSDFYMHEDLLQSQGDALLCLHNSPLPKSSVRQLVQQRIRQRSS